MLDRPDLAYLYDGSFEGLLSVVFACFAGKERPGYILGPESPAVLFDTRYIPTDPARAARVREGISLRISADALGFVVNAFRTCLPDRELEILDFLVLGFKVGPRVMERFSEPGLNRLYRAVLSLQDEAHLLKGFVRFSDYGGVLSATIHPRNDVLPLMMPHFLDRYPNEAFMILDAAHHRALLGKGGRGRIVPLEGVIPPEPDEAEAAFRRLWQLYYDRIAIKERENPVCRRSHMPKRFWADMTEFQRPQASASRLAPAGLSAPG